jgi:hypothetical protein
MLTIEEFSHILTEMKMDADPFTVRRWIHEGKLGAEREENGGSEWNLSEESLRRLIRRHVRALHEENLRRRQERDAVIHEMDRLREQLATLHLAYQNVNAKQGKQQAEELPLLKR